MHAGRGGIAASSSLAPVPHLPLAENAVVMGFKRFNSSKATSAQKEARMRNLAKANARHNKENILPPSTLTPIAAGRQLSHKTVSRDPVPCASAAAKKWKKKFESASRANRRYRSKINTLKEQTSTSEKCLRDELNSRDLTIAGLSSTKHIQASRIAALQDKLDSTLATSSLDKKSIQALKKRVKRFGGVLQRAISRTRRKALCSRGKIKVRGIYSPEMRHLARVFSLAGCAPDKIGDLIQATASAFGIRIPDKHKMSRRTAARCVLEALPASEIQLGYEVGMNAGLTLSQDSTSNRNVNYQAHHVNLRVPDYSAGETTLTSQSHHTTRLLRVDSTHDHTSEKAMDSWLVLLKHASETYNNSPLARRTKTAFTLRQFALKLKGMNTDHASTEQCTSDRFKAWKHSETLLDLGERKLAQRDFDELLVFLNAKKADMIDLCGGLEVWSTLDALSQARKEAELLKELTLEIGEQVYDALSDSERGALNLFVWAGCCMHKDQNSFKGGVTAMEAFWALNGLERPVLLANKANAAKVRDILNPSRAGKPFTEGEMNLLEASTRGGVKAAALAGSLLNNKDSKKGYGDTPVIHFAAETGQKNVRIFPDTSNTRFGSHGLAICELVKHRHFYAHFIEEVRLRKHSSSFTNIELNVSKALQDPPTLTEFAAIVYYVQTIGQPYIRVARATENGAQVNALSLGPFHKKVLAHCLAVIEDPDLVLSETATFETATLDGQPWDDPDAITAVRLLQKEGKVPHLKGALVALYTGAAGTWTRFSSEYAPEGVIDKLNLDEQDLAWMPATNDANEGALGAYRVHVRNKPSTTLLTYNAHAVCHKNDTLAFMNTVLNDEDLAYIRKQARILDSSGLERKRKAELAAFEKQLAETKRQKEEATKRAALEKTQRLEAVKLVDIEGVDRSSMAIPASRN
ncbi:hypothetical protein NMY22_g11627 [Coprinellus aureogranulatus]|nr:hypothetical protein NMY22_g11627 [Coprinellus aureogranulatus]